MRFRARATYLTVAVSLLLATSPRLGPPAAERNTAIRTTDYAMALLMTRHVRSFVRVLLICIGRFWFGQPVVQPGPLGSIPVAANWTAMWRRWTGAVKIHWREYGTGKDQVERNWLAGWRVGKGDKKIIVIYEILAIDVESENYHYISIARKWTNQQEGLRV